MRRCTMTALVLMASSFALAAGGHSGGSDAEAARFRIVGSGLGFLSVENAAQDGVAWDMNALKRLDFTNKAYEIANGRVDVDLISGTTPCPTGLGHLASGMSTVNQICIRYEIARDGDYHLKVTWNPGGSGREQFAVASNGQSAGESEMEYRQLCTCGRCTRKTPVGTGNFSRLVQRRIEAVPREKAGYRGEIAIMVISSKGRVRPT